MDLGPSLKSHLAVDTTIFISVSAHYHVHPRLQPGSSGAPVIDNFAMLRLACWSAVLLTASAATPPNLRAGKAAVVTPPAPALLRLRGGVAIEDELRLSMHVAQAAALGALIGIERGWARRPAGYRTMSLVAMGAALFTGVGRLSYSDGARIAAQVASGVGFIGAGVIQSRTVEDMKKHASGAGDYLKGLTTACAIWISAGIGVACGSGHGIAASMSTLLSLLILYSYRFAYGDEVAEKDMWHLGP